jgi:hypothetical protein
LRRQIAIKLSRFLAMLQSPLLHFPGFGIHPCNLLKSQLIVTTSNHHVRLLSPGPLVGWHHQSLLGHWSRHCYGIIYTNDLGGQPTPAVALLLARCKIQFFNELCSAEEL